MHLQLHQNFLNKPYFLNDMLNLKKGLPEEGDILICTVTKIHYHSVFTKLDEYENKQGFIHISEISSGRIRNVSDYVQEGKKIVCKVLKINTQRGNIDLSLRRVSGIQKRNKIEELKQEQKAEKILEFVASQNSMKVRELNDLIAPKLLAKYSSLHSAFEEVSFGDLSLETLGISKELSDQITELIKQRIKLPVVQISGDVKTISYEPNGAEITKKILVDALKISKDVQIKYGGAGKYFLVVTKNDYKDAEEDLKKVLEFIEVEAKKVKSTFEYKRRDSRKIKT